MFWSKELRHLGECAGCPVERPFQCHARPQGSGASSAEMHRTKIGRADLVSGSSRFLSQCSCRQNPVLVRSAVDQQSPAPASEEASGTIKAVLFDMDGVLCNSEELSRR